MTAPTITISPIAGDNILNAGQAAADLAISGTTTGVEDGQQVTVALNGNTYTATVSGSAWTATVPAGDLADTVLANGSYAVTADVANLAGTPASEASQSLTVNETPTITISPIAGDNILNAGEAAADLAISGTTTGVEDGQQVTVALNGNTYTATVSGNAWTATVPAGDLADTVLANGSYAVTADVANLAGTPASEASQSLTVNETPTITISPIAGDNILNAGEAAADLAISGTTTGVEDGQQVTVALNGNTYTATVSGNAWTATVPAGDLADTVLANGSYAVTADVANLAGTPASEASQSLTVNETPTITISPIAGDNILNAGEAAADLAISGTTTGVEDGQQVTVALNGNTYTATVSGNAWTATVPAGDLADTVLANGSYAVTADVANLAGTPASEASQSLTVDETAPSAPDALALAAASDSGTKGDNITNVALPMITGTGETGDTVNLFDGSSRIGTGTVTGDVWSITSLTPLTQGNNTITATQTDVAGNTSVASGPMVVTLDTTAPSAPATLALAAASDSGTKGDNITNVALPMTTGTGETGDTVNLFDGSSRIGTGTVTGGVWSITSLTPLTQGNNTITATQTDVAGNTSVASGPMVVTLDTTAPSAPATLALAAASDSGTKGDNITNVALPMITGTGETGDTVNLFDGSSRIGTGTVTGDVWSITSLTPLTQGNNTITATQTDVAGNTSVASGPMVVTLDTTAPSAPATLALAAASDSGTKGDNITNVALPMTTGTGETGDTVNLFDGSSRIGTGTVTGGVWSITSLTPLTQGNNTITATQTDVAGNTSVASGPMVVTLAPPVTLQMSMTLQNQTGQPVGDVATAPTLQGTGAPNTTVTLTQNGQAVAPITTDADGNWTFDPSSLAAGVTTISATETSANGSTTTASFTLFKPDAPVNGAAATTWTSSDVGKLLESGATLVNPTGTDVVQLADGQLSVGTETTEAFVARLYEGLLGRTDDTAGLSFWNSSMAGQSQADIAAGFLGSAEYQAAHQGLSNAAFMASLYTGVLGRTGDAAGIANWTQDLAAGATRADVLAAFASGPEAQQHWSSTTSQGEFAYNPDAASIREVYATAFGREAEVGAFTTWSSAMQGGMTLADFGAAVANSAEFNTMHNGQSNADFVASLYQDGLGRQAEAAGAVYWTSQINNGAMTRGGVTVGIAASAEGQHHLSWAL